MKGGSGCYCSLSPSHRRFFFKIHAKKCSRYSTWGIPSVHNPSLIALPTHTKLISLHRMWEQFAICSRSLQSYANSNLKSVSFSIESSLASPHTDLYVHNSYEHISILISFTSSTFPVCVWMLFFRHLWKFLLLSFADKAKTNIK